MRLIDGNALYEKACDLEAQALDYTVKISNDEEKREEWLRWSAILAERTAFKHDVYDAPTIELEPRWIPCSERLPEVGRSVLFSVGGMYTAEGCMRDDGDWCQFRWSSVQKRDIVDAWMPLPKPYGGEQDGSD